MKKDTVLFVKKIIFLLLGLTLISIFVSCDYFAVDIKTTVVENLERAVFQNDGLVEDIKNLKNSNGDVCIPYNYSGETAAWQVRNPRSFPLKMEYSLSDGSEINDVFYGPENNFSNVSQKLYDVALVLNKKGEFKIYFSPYFLRERELASARDISGIVKMIDTDRGRTNEERVVKLRVNTPPPAVDDEMIMLQRDSTATKYVLCFMMPIPEKNDIIHSDTHLLCVNTELADGGSSSVAVPFIIEGSAVHFSNEAFSTERPEGLKPLKDNGEMFEENNSEKYIPVYYETGVNVTTSTVDWDVFLRDEEGLESEKVYVSNNERALTNPEFKNAQNGGTYVANVDDGYFRLEIYHDGMCLDGKSAEGNVRILCSVLDSEGNVVTEPVATNTTSSSYEVTLPRGEYSVIEIYAKKPRFTPSDHVRLTDVTITHAADIDMEFNGNVKNYRNEDCIESTGGIAITGAVNNARDYDLDIRYELSDGTALTGRAFTAAEADAGLPDYSRTSPYDYYCVLSDDEDGEFEIGFTEKFLRTRDVEGNRDISGNILLSDKDSARTFDPYPVTLRVNTQPLAVRDVMLQRNSNGTKYILCFMMPKLAQIDSIHADTHILKMNDDVFYFNSNNFDGTFYADAGRTSSSPSFSTTRPSGLRPLKDDSDLFPTEAPASYIAVYYETDVNVTVENKLWSLFIEDDEGLKSDSESVSNNALSAPVIESNVENGGAYWLNDDGEFKIKVSHNGKCIDNVTTVDSVSIFLIAYDNSGTPTKTLNETVLANQDVEFNLSRGYYATIKIYAKKNGYGSSDYVVLSGITVKQATQFYVSSSGSDSNVGTKNKPFRTINKTVNNFLENFQEPDCTIKLLDDITPSSLDFTQGSTSLVTVPTGASEKNLIIIDGNNHAVDARGNGRVMTINGGTVRLKNLTVKGGSAVNGGGIYIEENASVVILDSSVTNNTATGNGGGVYVNGTLGISGNVTVTGNTKGSGTNAPASNVYLCEDKLINVGELDATSCIGVTTAVRPEIGGASVVFTSGFGENNNDVTPNTIFLSDKEYAVSISDSEVGLSRSGGSFSEDPLDNTLTLTFSDSAGNSVSSFVAGTSKQVRVKATDSGNTVVSPNDITYTFVFKTFDGDFIANLTPTISGNFAVVTIPATRAGQALLPDTYRLYVTARYNNVTYDSTLTLEGEENSSSGGGSSGSSGSGGFVAVTGATVTGAVSGSDVFIAGRNVTIPNMYVSDHEVTQKEWYDVFNVTQETMDSEHNNGRGNNYPVYSVNWYGAIAYCNKKSVADGLTPCYSVSGVANWATFSYSSIPTSNNETWNEATCDFNANGYRLPTEAEWEYIARGGNNGIPTTQYTYSGSNTISNVAWYGLNGGTSGGTAHVVKGKTPNSRGVYDMSGNVWELCWDWYSTSITTSTSSTGVSEGTDRVVRGGSWSNSESDCTVATRWGAPENFSMNDCIGFRVVRTAQ